MTYYVSVPPTATTIAWNPNSRATNHITSDVLQLGNMVPSVGSDHVQIGDGSSLSIAQIGDTSLLSSVPLALRRALHVPSISKNIISVCQFMRNNNVFFEFHPDVVLVKDRATGEALLNDRVNNGLYLLHLLARFSII